MYQFADNLKSDKAFFFYTGSTALYALLKAMGVGPGDEVILQVFTCPGVPSPVVRLGATPVYVDIDPKTFSIDPDKIEARISGKTRVIIAQHTFGIPAEMDAIIDIAHRHRLWVIEDSCHALGSKYRGKEVGTIGDGAIYSFGWYKPIALGAGGAAVVNNPTLRPRVGKIFNSFVMPPRKQMLVLGIQCAVLALLFSPSRFWVLKEVYRRLRDFGSGPRKGQIRPLILGHSSQQPLGKGASYIQGPSLPLGALEENMRPPRQKPVADVQNEKAEGRKIIPFQKGRLFRKLDRWHEMVEYQRWIVSRYRELLSQVGYTLPKFYDYLESVYYKYPLLSDRKREIFEQAPKARIEMSDMFGSPLYPPERRANWKALGYIEGMCPISESVSNRIIALPVHSRVRSEHIERSVAFLASFR